VAIGAIARGDLVVVHSARLGVHGLFVVDSVSGNAVSVTKVEDANATAGGIKTNVIQLDKTTDILSVHTASSISA
jgi:hypothetical protein